MHHDDDDDLSQNGYSQATDELKCSFLICFALIDCCKNASQQVFIIASSTID